MKTIAKTVSIIFHPVFVPIYTLLILFNLDTYFALIINDKARLIILGFVIITTIILPVSSIYIMKKMGIISSIEMEKREDRIMPFILTAGFFFLAYYTLKGLQLPAIYTLLFLLASMMIVLALVITFFWKISSHSMGMGSLSGVIIGLSINLHLDLLWLVIAAIIASGLTASARLTLMAHTRKQVYTGYLLGLLGFLAGLQLLF